MTIENPIADKNRQSADFFKLRLFVAGQEPNSVQALNTFNRVITHYLKDRCEYMIIDVLRDYEAALRHKVIAVPTLLIEAPPPRRMIIGSMRDEKVVLESLGVAPPGGQDV